MAASFDILFTPLTVRHVTLPNRVVAPPMVQLRPLASAAGLAWYRRLAAGGAGLVIVEATGVPAFEADLDADALRPLVDAIHDHGATAAIQLFPLDFGAQARPADLTTGELDLIVERYGRAAATCRDAGFDGVEPHGAHNYLLNQFFMPDRNQRTDAYGGTDRKRGRLALAIVERIRQSVGDDLLVLYRHTPTGDAYDLDDSLAFARRLVAAGVDVLDISPARRRDVADLAAPFKRSLDVPVIAVGGMDDPAAAAAALRDGRCDLIAVGRQLIADADWPAKVRDGRLSDVIQCEKCDAGCFGNLRQGVPVACSLWAGGELD